MTTDPTITCPSCSTEIKLTESLAAPIIQAVRKEYEAKIAQKESDVAKRESELDAQQKAVKEAQKSINEQVAEKLEQEKAVITEEEAKKAKRAVATDLEAKAKEVGELQDILERRDEQLQEAQEVQAEFLRKQRDLDDAKRELELTIEKRVQASVEDVRKKAQQEAEEELKLKVSEKEEQISSMQRQIEKLKRKADQGSQQLQGEVQELALETTLSAKFPLDSIEPVPKGEFGGDVLQKVVGPMGQACGAILWESKRTKNWSDTWLPKLRDDQRAAKAELAVLVSNAMPNNVDSFDHIDGVWVTQPRYAMTLVIALRQSLIEVANTRKPTKGKRQRWKRSTITLPAQNSDTASKRSSRNSPICNPIWIENGSR